MLGRSAAAAQAPRSHDGQVKVRKQEQRQDEVLGLPCGIESLIDAAGVCATVRLGSGLRLVAPTLCELTSRESVEIRQLNR